MSEQTITLKCCGCGEPVNVPLVGKRKLRPETHIRFCERPVCIGSREARRAAVRKIIAREVKADKNIDTPISDKNIVEGETSEGSKTKRQKADIDVDSTDLDLDDLKRNPKAFLAVPSTERRKQPAYLKSVSFPVVPDAKAPYGRDENGKPLVAMRSDLEIAGLTWVTGSEVPRPLAARIEYVPSKEIKALPQTEYNSARAGYLEKVFATSRVLSRPVRMTFVEQSIMGKNLTAPKTPKTKSKGKTELKIHSFREFFLMSRQSILALFDQVVRYEERFVEVKVLGDEADKAALESSIRELKERAEVLKEQIKSRSLRWLKKNQPDNVYPSKSDLQRLKYQDEKEVVECQGQRREKRQQMSDWETDIRNWLTITQFVEMPVVFGAKDPVSLTPVVKDLEYLPDTRKGSEIMTHTYMKVGDPYDVDGYRALLSDDQNVWDDGWREWENRVIVQAVEAGLIKPNREQIKRLGTKPMDFLASEELDSDAEIELIKKTGGASMGLGMNVRGRGKRGGKQRSLENFDATLERGKGKPEPGTGGRFLRC